MFSALLDFDLLSPSINISYKGRLTHSSYFSGFLSMCLVVICISFTAYCVNELFARTYPITYTTTRYQKDFGLVQMDQSQMFHFFLLFHTNGSQLELDERYFSFIGRRFTISLAGRTDFFKFEYGKCKWEIDAVGMEDIVERNAFQLSYCVRKATDLQTNQSYYKGSPQNIFPYPYISLGLDENDNNGKFSAFDFQFKECENTTLSSNCKPKSEIQNVYKQGLMFKLYFIDNNFDVSNYEKPVIKYMFGESELLTPGSYSTIHFNIFPTTIITSDNLLFDISNTLQSYKQNYNQKMTFTQAASEILTCYFWPKNQGTFYTRKYKRFQDICASAGGFLNFIIHCSIIINYFPHKYQTIKDSVKIFKDNNLKRIKRGREVKKSDVSSSNTLRRSINQVEKEEVNKEPLDSTNRVARMRQSSFNLRTMKTEFSPIDGNKLLISCYQEEFQKKYWGMAIYLWSEITCCLKRQERIHQEVFRIRKSLLSEEVLIKNIIDVTKMKCIMLKAEERRKLEEKVISIKDVLMLETKDGSQDYNYSKGQPCNS